MLEPAALGKATLFGPHTDNFRTDVDLLLASAAAVRVADRSELAAAIAGVLRDPAQRAGLGENARRVILRTRGVTVRTFDFVETLLQPPPGAAEAFAFDRDLVPRHAARFTRLGARPWRACALAR